VLQQERNLAVAEDNLIAANGQYAKDRASLYQILAATLQHYGINLQDAARGTVTTEPVIPGVKPAQNEKEPSMAPPPTNEQPAPPLEQQNPPAGQTPPGV